MNFGDAIKELKLGKRLQRTAWSGKGLFIYLVPAASDPVQTGAAKEHLGDGAMGRWFLKRLTWRSRTWTRR